MMDWQLAVILAVVTGLMAYILADLLFGGDDG